MRTDIHSPANFEPADYEYVGSFDAYPNVRPGEGVGMPVVEFDTDFGKAKGILYELAECNAACRMLEESGVKIWWNEDTRQCDHCGAVIRYVAVYRHKPTGDLLAVGTTCSDERFGMDSRRSYDIKRLKEAAKSRKEKEAAMKKALEFAESKGIEWMLEPIEDGTHHILADIRRKLAKWGSISEKQIAFAKRLKDEDDQRARNNGKTDKEARWDEEKAKAEDAPSGRVVVTGIVLKTDYQENDFGGREVMTVKDDRGFVVWGSVPTIKVPHPNDPELEWFHATEKGDRVSFTAALAPSDNDPKFAFYKRPTKVSLIEAG